MKQTNRQNQTKPKPNLPKQNNQKTHKQTNKNHNRHLDTVPFLTECLEIRFLKVLCWLHEALPSISK